MLLEFRNGLLPPPCISIDQSEIIVGLRVLGIQPEGYLQFLDRRPVLPIKGIGVPILKW